MNYHPSKGATHGRPPPRGLRALLEWPNRRYRPRDRRRVSGVSPLAAREVVFRTAGQPIPPTADLPWARLAFGAAGALERRATAKYGPERRAPSAYAPYLLTHLPGAARADR